jgi:hypothetical protein
MKFQRLRLLTLLLFLVPSLLSAQNVEKHTTVDAAGVSVGRPASMMEEIGGKVNVVEYEARHCQDYKIHHNLLAKVFLGRRSRVDVVACANDPATLFYQYSTHNLRTTAGGDWQASVMGNTAAPPATCNYIALTNDAGAPAAGDTTLASEIAVSGLSRAQGTYAHTGGTASFTVQKVFSATGTQASQKAGLLNASSSGTLCFENTYTAVTVNNGDTLTVTWTISY